MSNALLVPSVAPALSSLADEFKRLDQRRRHAGLSLGDAARYRALLEQLSDALDLGPRPGTSDTRQFLRVPFRLELRLRRGPVLWEAACEDFGGGGCSIDTDVALGLDEEVALAGALVEGRPHPLEGAARVAWSRLPNEGRPTGYGLRFLRESRPARDCIDRLLYHVLDVYLNGVASKPS